MQAYRLDMAGRLAVSVIEARDVDGDTAASEQLYYVRLRLDTLVHKTAPASGSCPRFLKDVLFEVKEPQKEALMVELCQVGPHGDLVVGSCQVLLWGLTGAGTSVQWLTLNNAAAAAGGRLCVVFRYAANPAATRSASPPRVATPPLSGSIRAPSPSAATPGAAATTPAAAATSTSGRTTPAPAEQQSSRKADVATPSTPTQARQQQGAQQPQRSPSPQQRAARSGSPAASLSIATSAGAPARTSSALDDSVGLSPRLTTTKSSRQRSGALSSAKPASGTSSKRSSSGKHKSAAVAAAAASSGLKLKALAQHLPVPLAMAGGLLLGAVGFLWHQRDILYEVQETDLVCTMGACVLRGSNGSSGAAGSGSNRRQGRVEIIPEAVIPGDRLRLK